MYSKEEQAANRAAWVAALRSGKYKQTVAQLADDVGHCCLGVACEVAVEAGVVGGYAKEGAVLPRSVQNWLGLDTASGRLIDSATELTVLNDDEGYSFAEIADLIESNRVALA